MVRGLHHGTLVTTNAQRARVAATADITGIGFSRDKLAKMFGGNKQAVAPYPDKKRWEGVHDYEVLLYPSCDLNPHVPKERGCLGVLFIWWSEVNPKTPIPLFMKHNNKSPIMWYYYGHYEVRDADPLSAEDYAALPASVSSTLMITQCSRRAFKLIEQAPQARNEWIKGVLTAPWGRSTRAAVLFMKLNGRDGSDEEINALVAPNGLGVIQGLTVEDVDNYYLEGHGVKTSSLSPCA